MIIQIADAQVVLRAVDGKSQTFLFFYLHAASAENQEELLHTRKCLPQHVYFY